MTNFIPIEQWLKHIEREYMDSFLKDGGSAVKFAIVEDDNCDPLTYKLKSSCHDRNFLFIKMDAITSRVHMPQDVFFSLAAQLDWWALARRVVLDLLKEDFRIPDEMDIDGPRNIIETVAEYNNIEPKMINFKLLPQIQEKITKNPYMAKAFRVAMTHLCLGVGDSGHTKQPLLDWLTGTNPRISNVKPYQIHTPINRTTARYFIESAVYWIKKRAGYSGTVILMNNKRVTLVNNPRDGMRYYTRAMTMDHYELLREFIDDVNRLTGTLWVTLSDPVFIDIDSPRGWNIYPALRTRVMDDVRDKNKPNPLASLVRLGEGGINE